MKPKTNADYFFAEDVARAVNTRLGCGVILQDLSVTDIEHLAFLVKPGNATDEFLAQCLNYMLELSTKHH